MLIRQLQDMKTFEAGDGSILKEFFNPSTEDGLDLRYSFAHAEIPAGFLSKWHTIDYSEVYYILEGTGKMYIDDEVSPVSSGSCIYIPPKARQRLENTGSTPVKFLCIVDPAWCPDSEVVEE